jgi:hypothetical protein
MSFRVVLRITSKKSVDLMAVALIALLITGYAQGSLLAAGQDTLYSVSYYSASLDAVLIDLVEMTDIDLVYNPGLTENKRITLEMSDSTAEQILAAVVRQAGLRYHRLDTGTYVINRPPGERPPPPPPPPPAVIHGSVFHSETGEPVANVRIISAGKMPVVFTDSTGFFKYADVPAGPHLLVAGKEGYSMAFYRAEALRGETTDVHIMLHPKPVSVEIPDTSDFTKVPVYNSVIAGIYDQDSIVFPEWNGTRHDAWLSSLPGIITMKPVSGYHGLSIWSADHAGSAQGLFLFTGRMPGYTTGRGSIGPGNRWSPAYTNESRPDMTAEIELSDTFLSGGVSPAHVLLRNGVFMADASFRMINPVTSDNSRMIDDLTRWIYPETVTGLNSTGAPEREVHMETDLFEAGVNLDYIVSDRLTAGLRLNAGKSDLDVNRTGGTFLLYPVWDSFDSRYDEVSQYIRYDAGSEGFYQKLHTRHSRFNHQEYANGIVQRYSGSYSLREIGLEAGYTRALTQMTGLQASYLFNYGSYDAEFNSGLFNAATGSQNRVADHRVNAGITMKFDSGLSVSPELGILKSSLATSPVLDPGIALEFKSVGYPRSGFHLQAGWHQHTQYRHRFFMPVPAGSVPVPFYDVTLASRVGEKPVVVNYSYFDATYHLNETATIRFFSRYGIQKQLQRPDLSVEATDMIHLPDQVYLTDSQEFRVGGVLYGFSREAGMEASFSYSYGNNSEINTDRFNGERVQAAGNVPHQVKTSALWAIGSNLKLGILWESRFGNMNRALHERYYVYRQVSGPGFSNQQYPDPAEHRLDAWHRLDAGIIFGQRIADINFTISVQLMNILNRRNHMDTVMITDLSSPEPEYYFRKRRMPGFYPQFSFKVGF